MTDLELQQQRAHLWRQDGNPARSIEQARALLQAVGFCLMYPVRSLPLVPTFMGAYIGAADGLPDTKHAYADPRAQEAVDLMVRMLRERSAYEVPLLPDTHLIISAQMFPFFYALLSDHNPKAPPKTKAQGVEMSLLAGEVFAAIQKEGPLSRDQLREKVGRQMSNPALDRALGDLWSILKITRVNYTPSAGASWDVLYRWAPDAVKEGINISAPEAVTALVSKYLETVVAATQEEIEQFLSHLVPRSKIREAVNALLAARESSFTTAGARTLIQMAPAADPAAPPRHSHG
ncbi:MAG TPA: crosslink repair DNA glycosylase YcaQ family protein [Verrucomicrobiae bacterium]|jgi:23S rRNA pseudouridine2605 synthase|nr:crosslink repair DNA glycosylase YcaQ family protein [Verrucomicrobiae bacterium]